MEFREVVENRYSCKKYGPKKVDKKILEAILEAGRVAPTAKNLQEQHIYVVVITIDDLFPRQVSFLQAFIGFLVTYPMNGYGIY